MEVTTCTHIIKTVSYTHLVQKLANLKNLSFNRTVITLLKFSLDNLDDDDKSNIG